MTKKEARGTDYYFVLDRILDDVFAWADRYGINWAGMARLSGLSYTTVMRLGNRRTVFPSFRTVLLLSKGLGFNLDRALNRPDVRRVMHKNGTPKAGAA
jgi:hypothetical protein